MSKRFIDVAAGLIIKPDGQLLLAQRPGDKPWSGWWELPGGKIEPGETPAQALARELNEELGIVVTRATPWVTYTHEYPNTIVRLWFHRVTAWEGEARGAEGQNIAWTKSLSRPAVSPLLPATQPPLRWLQLPGRYLLTSIRSANNVDQFLERLAGALSNGVRLVQFREPEWASVAGHDNDAIHSAFERVVALCRQHDAYCLVNSAHPQAWWDQADGVHYRAADAAELARQMDVAQSSDGADSHKGNGGGQADDNGKGNGPIGDKNEHESVILEDLERSEVSDHDLPGALRRNRYVAMSAHNENDLQIARRIQADFAVLGHVLDTPSHSGVPGKGWDEFARLNAKAGLPVLAIGGQSSETADVARQHGAHGIAGIRGIMDAS